MLNTFMKNRQSILRLLMWGWLIICFVVLMTNIYNYLPNMLDSDMASIMAYSKQVRDDGRIFSSSNWFYSTGADVFSIHLIYTLLFWFTDNWFVVRIVGNAALYIIMLLALFFMCKQDDKLMEFYPILGGICILPFSKDYYQNVLYAEYYISYVCISFFIMGAIFMLTKTEISIKELSKHKGETVVFLTASVVSVMAGVEDLRQIMVFYIPMFATAGYMFLKRKKTGTNDISDIRRILISGFFLFLSLIGYLINSKVLSNVFQFKSYEFINWSVMSADRFYEVIYGWLQSMGYSYGEVFSISSVVNISIFLMIGLLFYIIFVAARENIISDECETLCIYYLIAFLCFSFLMTFTDMFYIPRYNLPIVAFSPIIVVIGIDYILRKNHEKNLIIAIVMCLIFVILGGKTYLDHRKSWLGTTNTKKLIADFLVEQDYHEGYASFWNANVMTELSKGKLEVWNIGDNVIINFNGIHRWLQKKSHTEDYPSGKLFVITTEKEKENVYVMGLLEDKNLIFNEDGYYVYGYSDISELPDEVWTYNPEEQQ